MIDAAIQDVVANPSNYGIAISAGYELVKYGNWSHTSQNPGSGYTIAGDFKKDDLVFISKTHVIPAQSNPEIWWDASSEWGKSGTSKVYKCKEDTSSLGVYYAASYSDGVFVQLRPVR